MEMAQAAKEMLASATRDLDEAIRQTTSYMEGHQPSTRILQQRIQRVREKEEEYKRVYYTYHEKAKLDIDSGEVMQNLQEKLDKVADVVDEATIFIEDKEFKQHEEERLSSEMSYTIDEKRKVDIQYQRCVTEVSIDERIAKDLCQKVEKITAENVLTITKHVLMKTHLDGLVEILKILSTSWKELLALQVNEGEREVLGC